MILIINLTDIYPSSGNNEKLYFFINYKAYSWSIQTIYMLILSYYFLYVYRYIYDGRKSLYIVI